MSSTLTHLVYTADTQIEHDINDEHMLHIVCWCRRMAMEKTALRHKQYVDDVNSLRTSLTDDVGLV